MFYSFGSGVGDVELAPQPILVVAIVFGVVGALVQHVRYDSSGDAFGEEFEAYG